MISKSYVLILILFLDSNSADVIKRQNAFLNITSNSMQSILLFDSILFGFNSPQNAQFGQLIKTISFNSSNSKFNNYGCSRYVNELLPSNYVALVSRGECSFETKIKIAFECKASAIIVYNSENSAFVMFSNSKLVYAVILCQLDTNKNSFSQHLIKKPAI